MNIVTALISLLISTSLYPAATPPRSGDGAHASASATPAAEVKSALSAIRSSTDSTITLPDPTDVKRAAAETDSKTWSDQFVAQADQLFDGEIDTKQLRAQRTPPTEAELQQALERAEKQNAKFAILLELAQPYAPKDPHVFALELFQRWHALCARKGVLEAPGPILNLQEIVEEIRPMDKEARDKVPLIAWCCLGIVHAHSLDEGFVRPGHWFTFTTEMDRIQPSTAWYGPCMIYKEAEYGFIKRSDELYRKAQHNAPLIQGLVAQWLLPELAVIVERYSRQDRIIVAEAPPLQLARDCQLYLSGCMIGSVEGLCDCVHTVIDLRFNIVTRIGRYELPKGGNLQTLLFYGNPISSIAPYAFVGQTALRELGLEECQLTHISRPMFAGLINLKSLRLNANPISQIEQGAIAQLCALTELNIRHAALQTVPEDMGAFVAQGRLVTLDLDGNPLESNPEQNEIKKKLLELVAANAGQTPNQQ